LERTDVSFLSVPERDIIMTGAVLWFPEDGPGSGLLPL